MTAGGGLSVPFYEQHTLGVIVDVEMEAVLERTLEFLCHALGFHFSIQ